jgi:hypothetical protein
MFSPAAWRDGETGAFAIPPVFAVEDASGGYEQSMHVSQIRLTPLDHLRFNIQWTLVIWSFFLYPCVFADLFVNAGDRTHRVNSATVNVQDSSSNTPSLPMLEGNHSNRCFRCKGTIDKFGNSLFRWATSASVVRFCGVINMLLGFTTITIYSYQTYSHGGEQAIAGVADKGWSRNVNFYLCVIDTIIDVVALSFQVFALIFVPMSKQNLAYLSRTDNVFLIIGASSNLVYCLQVFNAQRIESMFETTGVVLSVEPDPHTLTFLRMVPIVNFINWIAPRFFVTSREQWQVYRVYLQLFAACVVVAGAMMTIERIGDPKSWRPGYDDGSNGWPMFKALWFVVVTSSTVGYGDFTTSTVIGRVLTVVIIFTGLPKFTQYAGQVWELLLERRQGAGLVADVAGRPFIVLAGNINLRLAKLWTSQLYGEPLNSSVVVVILSRSDEGEQILDWIRFNAKVKGLVYYIRGDLDDEDNLRRAQLFPSTKAKTCLGVFLLCDVSRGGSAVDDANNVARLQKLKTMGTKVTQHLFTGVATNSVPANEGGDGAKNVVPSSELTAD